MASRATAGQGRSRLADCVTGSVLARAFPLETIRAILAETGRASQHERELPAHVMVYYVIALALYMPASYGEVLRTLLEGARWLAGPEADPQGPHIACPSAITQARERLGEVPLVELFTRVTRPVATPTTPGAFYRGWRLVSLDGMTFDVPDSPANATAFGRPSASQGVHTHSAFPQVRLLALVETGTHVAFGAALGAYDAHELTLVPAVVLLLAPGMLCLADRAFLGFDLWQAATRTGAALLWRARKNAQLPVLARLADGSYRSEPWRRASRTPSRAPRRPRVRQAGSGSPSRWCAATSA